MNERVSLNPEAYGAAAFRFPAAKTPKKLPSKSGALPNLAHRATPVVTPVVARGEFVREELATDTGHSKEGLPAWRAAAVLTKGNVDTWLFARFLQPQPLDLEGADCLVVDTWVPEGQRTSNEILVIVHEKDGGDFLANTGRSLGAPGRSRIFVPLTRLQLAGWSQDADGVLDLKRVDEIRVGWGGYYGAEGEHVEFSVAVPEIGVVGGRAR